MDTWKTLLVEIVYNNGEEIEEVKKTYKKLYNARQYIRKQATKEDFCTGTIYLDGNYDWEIFHQVGYEIETDLTYINNYSRMVQVLENRLND